MAKKNNIKESKITTIKIRKETKERIDHLKEYERETYDEIIKKLLYILNTARTSPESARNILMNIDLKLKRKKVYLSIPDEKFLETGKTQEKFSAKPELKSQLIKQNPKLILKKNNLSR